MKFPKREKRYYGSVFEECKKLFLVEITQNRIQKLKVWIEGVQEGEVCKGSIKIKDE
jgi:hypothetical protein